jgi:hypothetical protein
MEEIKLSENMNNSGSTYSQSTYNEYYKTGKKDLFEEVIDSLMLNKYSNDDSFTEKVRSATPDKKRMLILTRLDNDKNLWTKITDLIWKSNNRMDYIKEVVLMLREFVKVGEVEKKKYGEVMTPLELVEDMLNTLPKDVWSNPNLKWLDPANGTGPFPIIVIYKLMNGLKEWQPDEEKRYKHIVENMIYTCELQDRNVFLWLCAVDPKDEYTTNTYWGSFLEEGFDKHMKEVWGLEKFDIVIGNHPYQEQVGYKKTEPLWNKFIIKSDKVINNGGFFVLVHPSGWRSPSGKFRNIYELYIKYDILILNINDFDKGKETFGVGTNYDFYCIKKTNNKIMTKIIDIDGIEYNINVKELTFIPNGKFELFNKLVAKDSEERVEVLYSRSAYGSDKKNISKEETEEFKYPCVYTITQKNDINLFYSNTNKNGHFKVPKVIWSNGLGTYPVVDVNGEYGLTQFSYGIIDEVENLDNIKNYLKNEKFVKLMSYVRFTNHKYDYKVISTFKKDFWKEFID